MRITFLRVNKWRNFEGVELSPSPETRLVCLVGENGTGKSAILELLSVLANRVGISRGIDIVRGNPLEEVHDIAATVLIPREGIELEATYQQAWQDSGELEGHLAELTFTSKRMEVDGPHEHKLTLSAIEEPSLSQNVASRVVSALSQRRETQHLYLDADRSYPPMQIQPHQYSDILGQDWDSDEFTMNWSFRPTRTLYEEWNKYFVATEERASTEYFAAARRDQRLGLPQPPVVDPFTSYREAVEEVLPHLSFVGVRPEGATRGIFFDSGDVELPFSHLSGGEREIAFLVGQIERFRLRRGLLLIDEPELHLNPDLLRIWLAYLRDTVDDGQVWIATHSLEAVEVSGPESTFVFRRDSESRRVSEVSPLEGLPLLAALSTSVGSPAFTLSGLRFIYVEGDGRSGERERFHALCGEPETNRFLEGGSCHEVLRRLEYVKDLAAATDEQLRVGAVIDRDFRSDSEISILEAETGVHVLGCHEAENIFLHPVALAELIKRDGRELKAEDVLTQASDHFAGLWVGQRAAWRVHEEFDVPKAALSAIGASTWEQIGGRWLQLREASSAVFDHPETGAAWEAELEDARTAYEQMRVTDDLWARCLGKQTLRPVAEAIGLHGPDALRRQIGLLWRSQIVEVPDAVEGLRAYVKSLSD